MFWVYEFEGKIRFCKNKEERKYLSCLYTCISVCFLYFRNLIIKNNESEINCSKIMSEKVHFNLGDKLPTVYDAPI